MVCLFKVHVYINNLPADLAAILKESVLSMMEEFAATTQRQLHQFLQGGIYSIPATPEQRQKMSHCKLNNLFGEACLGDLDFSLFKRRNSSVHHHSTVNMLKRNKPISKFLLKKTEEEQHRLLSFARTKAAPLREEHRSQEKAVVLERQEYLLQQRARKEVLSAMRERRKLEAVRAVQCQGGLCLDRASVERLMAQHQTKTAKFSALSVQLRYHRVVLSSGSKLLNKTKLTPDQITANLILYLGTSEGMSTPALQDVPPPLPAVEHEDAVEACRPERGRKRKRRGAKKTPRQEEAEGEEEENQEEQEQAGQTEDGEDVMLELEDGKFSQGQAIAVYYDNNFYLGEVLQSHEDDTAEVSFMDQVPNKNIFRWKHEDIDVVHKKFVFLWNVRLASQNGRSWSTADYVKLVRLYTLFQEEYCQ